VPEYGVINVTLNPHCENAECSDELTLEKVVVQYRCKTCGTIVTETMGGPDNVEPSVVQVCRPGGI